MRKSPQEQIDAARKALARAQVRQRALDARRKIVLGGMLLAWLREDDRVRRALLSRLAAKPPRDQDAEVIEAVLDEFRGDHADVRSATVQNYAE